MLQVVPLFADKTALFGLWVDRNAPLRRLAAWLEEQQRRCGLPLALPRLELQLTGCILLRMAMEQLWELQKASGGRQQGGELSDRAIVGIAMKVVKTWLKHGPREGQPSALMCQAELLLMKRQLEEAFETIGMAMERAAEMKGGQEGVAVGPGLCLNSTLATSCQPQLLLCGHFDALQHQHLLHSCSSPADRSCRGGGGSHAGSCHAHVLPARRGLVSGGGGCMAIFVPGACLVRALSAVHCCCLSYCCPTCVLIQC